MLKIGTREITALRLGEREITRAYLGEALVFGGGKSPSRLPEGYTEVEYIKSDGEQYIDTLEKPATNTIVKMDVQLLELPTSGGYFAYSYLNDISAGKIYAYYIGVNSASKYFGLAGGYANTQSSRVVGSVNDFERISVELNNASKYAAIGESKITFANNSVKSSMATIKVLGLPASNRIKAKLFFCNIRKGSTQTRDFVPCIDPSGAVGLYDLVNSKFYKNAGTGAFTAGPAV